MGGGGDKVKIQELERARKRAEEQAALKNRLDSERAASEQKAKDRAQELFGQGSLGTRSRDEIAADLQDVVARRKAALNGLTPEERQAIEQQGLQNIQQQNQTALRQLRGIQGAQGIRGGLASAQQAQQLIAGQNAAGNLQRDIELQNINLRRQGLTDFENTIGAEQERAQREKFGQLSTELGLLGADLGRTTGNIQLELAQKGLGLAEEKELKNQGKK